MKKLLVLIMVSMMMIVLNGCKTSLQDREDVEDLEFVKVLGVDKKKDKVKLIASSKIAQSGGGEGTPEIKPDLLVSEGNTLFNAMRRMHTYSKKRPFLGMAEFVVIGEDGAKFGLNPLTDFIMRDHESRLNATVFVVKGESAENLMKEAVKSDLIIGDVLESLEKRSGNFAMSKRVYMYELCGMLDSKTLSPYLPCIQIINGVELEGGHIDSNIELMGLAVFKDDKLSYYLDGIETRAFNFIIGDIKSGVITVKDQVGQEVSLEIITATRKIKTYINDGIPSVDLTINMSSNLDEQWSAEDLTEEEALDLINTQQSEVIKEEVIKVINKAQQNNTDIFGFGDAIHRQHPGKWKNIEDKWEELFPKIKINVNVKSIINRTYDMREPSQYEKKGKKK